MSVVFYVEDSSLKQDDWQKLLNTYTAENEIDMPDGVEFHNDHAQVLFPGSIRGLIVNVDSESTSLRLNSLSSRLDWKAAFGILKTAMDEGGGSLNKEGEPYDPANLSPEQAETECMADFAFAMGAVRQALDGSSAALPISHFSVQVTEADFANANSDDPESLLAVEAKLQERVSDFICAFTASVMTVEIEGKEIKLSNYHHEPTLFHKEVDYVSMHGTSRDVEGLVPREKVEEILQAYLVDAGDFWYLPTINFGGQAELWQALTDVAEHQNLGGGGDKSADPELEELAFEMLSAIVGEEGGVGALAVVGRSEHPEAALVLVGVSTAMEAMNDDSIAGNPQALLNHLVENEVKPEIATAVVRTIISRGAELSKAAGGSGGSGGGKSGCGSLIIAGIGVVIGMLLYF